MLHRDYSLYYIPTYHYEYLCFAYAPAFAGNYGYVMDDFGTAVIPLDVYGLEDSYWTED